jgi:hypothetical protein
MRAVACRNLIARTEQRPRTTRGSTDEGHADRRIGRIPRPAFGDALIRSGLPRRASVCPRAAIWVHGSLVGAMLV